MTKYFGKSYISPCLCRLNKIYTAFLRISNAINSIAVALVNKTSKFQWIGCRNYIVCGDSNYSGNFVVCSHIVVCHMNEFKNCRGQLDVVSLYIILENLN